MLRLLNLSASTPANGEKTKKGRMKQAVTIDDDALEVEPAQPDVADQHVGRVEDREEVDRLVVEAGQELGHDQPDVTPRLQRRGDFGAWHVG